MKKLITLLWISIMAPTLSAEFIGDGAMNTVSTVESTKHKHDDAHTILEGYLVKQLSAEHYLFKDNTGEIEVEIEKEEFKGLAVASSTRIRITGEIDKEWNKTIVDVDNLTLLK